MAESSNNKTLLLVAIVLGLIILFFVLKGQGVFDSHDTVSLTLPGGGNATLEVPKH